MRKKDSVDEQAVQLSQFELEIEELEEILAPTPSIPIPPPIRFR